LSAPALVGQNIIQVNNQADFAIGEVIVISPGTAIEEVKTIVGFGSIILDSTFLFDHPVTAIVQTGSIAPTTEAPTTEATITMAPTTTHNRGNVYSSVPPTTAAPTTEAPTSDTTSAATATMTTNEPGLVTANPTTGGADATLDAAGFKETTSLCCPQEMELFFIRLLDSMDQEVCSVPHVQGLMHWFSCVPDMAFQYMLDIINNGNPCKYWAAKGTTCLALAAPCDSKFCR